MVSLHVSPALHIERGSLPQRVVKTEVKIINRERKAYYYVYPVKFTFCPLMKVSYSYFHIIRRSLQRACCCIILKYLFFPGCVTFFRRVT